MESQWPKQSELFPLSQQWDFFLPPLVCRIKPRLGIDPDSANKDLLRDLSTGATPRKTFKPFGQREGGRIGSAGAGERNPGLPLELFLSDD